MNNLLKLLGQEEYDKLKALLGEDFEKFASYFDKDECIINTDGAYVKKEEVEAAPSVLNEGWLSEDGTIDMEKVVDESLKKYIESLNAKISDTEKKANQTILENAINTEAKNQGAENAEDVFKFLDLSKVEFENGVPKGVDKMIGDLKKEKPYLFKGEDVSKGFNPPKPNKANGYVDGMSFADAFELQK